MNDIQKVMDKIARDKSKHGTIISTNKIDRNCGKTYSLELIAEYFGYTVIKKGWTGSRENIKVRFSENVNSIRGSKEDFVIDEGYTLEEIREFKKYINVIFALWNPEDEKDIINLYEEVIKNKK